MSQLSVFAATLFGTLLQDESVIFQAPVDAYLTAVKTNPTVETAVAQGVAFQAAVAALVPTGTSAALKDTATLLQTFIDTQIPAMVAMAEAAATAAATPTPAPVVTPTPAPTVTPPAAA
jgi:hypothetical protein